MFEAFNKKEQRTYLAAESFKKFTDPREEEWVCCNELDCRHLKVYIKKEHPRKYKTGKEVFVVPHFFQDKNNEFKCNHTNEGDRHYNLKMQVASLIYLKELKFKIGNQILTYDEENLEGVEKIRGSNRADVLLEFEDFNPVLGKGVVMEIKDSENDDSIQKKEMEWSSKGFSLAWVDAKKDFSGQKPIFDTLQISNPYLLTLYENFKKLDEKICQRLRDLENWTNETQLEITNRLEEYKENLQYNKIELIEELKQIKIKTCRSCGWGSLNEREPGSIACWRKFKLHLQRFPDTREKDYSCEYWSSDKK